MTLAARKPAPLVGHPKPRIAPPTPVTADVKAFKATAVSMGITLMPWQETAARYLTAKGPDGRHLYREVCIVVARQNGKTTLMKPLIVAALRAGKRVMHIAQTRELPRHMFGVIAEAMAAEPDLFPTRPGKNGKRIIIWPRFGAGQEEISLANGGTYRIAASRNGGARGWTNDLVIIDELREMDTFDIINAAEPTLTMSPDPQTIYLSNAGEENSVVLNSVRDRADKDEGLAYLEWSAAPQREPDDPIGWAEANPALGHYPSVERTLESAYRRHNLGGTLPIFETEHLCRWVVTLRELFLSEAVWLRQERELPEPIRPFMGISLAPSGERASAAIAWSQGGEIRLRLLFDVTGSPIDTDRLGKDLRATAAKLKVLNTGYDPLTDAVLAKPFARSSSISGMAFANASAAFVSAVDGGKLQWADCQAVTTDLTWTARKQHDDSGSFQAVRADDDRPITAVLACIRAVWLASTFRLQGEEKPRRQAMGF